MVWVVIFVQIAILLLLSLRKTPVVTSAINQQPDKMVMADNGILASLLLPESQHRLKVRTVFRNCASNLNLNGALRVRSFDSLIDCFIGALKSAQYNSRGTYESPDPVQKFLSLPVINPHNPEFFIHSSNSCAGKNVNTLFVVPSAPDYFDKRQKVRKSDRGQYVRNRYNNATLLFFVGLPKDNVQSNWITEAIKRESEKYGDIVLINLEDTYTNILQKTLAILHWAIDVCPNAAQVIRTDDDVNVTVTDLVETMNRVHKVHTNFILGQKIINDVPARSNNKWHLSEQEYPYSTFPPYVLGGLIGYPMSTVRLLYEATLRLKRIWLDDVYVTGLCSKKLNISVLEDKKFVFEHHTKEGDFDDNWWTFWS